MSKYIELYSGNRNRNLYPEPASYQVPFSSTLQNINPGESKDPVVDGAIYYTFTLYPQNNDYRIVGNFQPGTNAFNLYLDPAQTDPSGNRGYSFITNFFKGYVIYKASDLTFSEPRYIRSFDPTTGLAKIDKPFTSMLLPEQYYMWQTFPTNQNYLYVPTIDNNYNFINTSELAYNGYYIVFETPNPNYSNSDNSNIFYRKISYYDNIYQVAYYDEPLPFTYDVVNDPPQKYTIRKSLPFERWTLPVTTRYNTVPPSNKIIGPLIGPVITLPSNSSNIDNYYTGKFVYFANNVADTYKGIYPQPLDSLDPISNIVFYPIYGLYYIKAYNGKTKELSVCYDRGKYKDYPLPLYKGIGYNIYYFVAGAGVSSFDTYLTYSELVFDNLAPYQGELSFDPQDYILPGKTYTVSFTLQDTSTGKELGFTTFTVNDNGNPIYTSPAIKKTSKQTVNFTITPTTTNLTLLFTYVPDPADLATETYAVAFYEIYFGGMAYDSSSITLVSGISGISQIAPQEYKATFDNIAPYEGTFSIQPQFVSRTGDPPDTYNISWCLKTFGTFVNPVYFQVLDGVNPIYTSPDITNNYSCITFSITPSTTPSNISFVFYYDSTSPLPKGVLWNYFFVLDQTIQETPVLNYATSVDNSIGMNIIDISNFNNDNFNPLSYNGTMVGVEQTVCYRISLLSLTLPNALLKTGSRIAFYPYVYVEFSNATTPNGASNQIIYSNNPNSDRALFIAPVTQLLQPEAKTFITLRGGGMSQLIKFKPNDNLKFSVYLPDGSLFETLDIDTLPPYDPQLGLQIDAVFSITRDNQSTPQSMVPLSLPISQTPKKR